MSDILDFLCVESVSFYKGHGRFRVMSRDVEEVDFDNIMIIVAGAGVISGSQLSSLFFILEMTGQESGLSMPTRQNLTSSCVTNLTRWLGIIQTSSRLSMYCLVQGTSGQGRGDMLQIV